MSEGDFLRSGAKTKEESPTKKTNEFKRGGKKETLTVSMNPIIAPDASFAAKPPVLPPK